MSYGWADNMQRETCLGGHLMSYGWADNMQRENLSRRTLNELRLGGQYAAGNLMSLAWADNMQRETPRRTFRREMVSYKSRGGFQTVVFRSESRSRVQFKLQVFSLR